MWQQNYTPVHGSLPLSTLLAAIPIVVLLISVGVLRKPAWFSAFWGLAAAALVAFLGYGMPVRNIAGAISFGAAFGLFPIGWVIFTAMLLYYLTLESGKFAVIKDSIAHITSDRRLQVILIGFSFLSFVEGAAGFGTPIAIAASMLSGLGLSSFSAAAVCLIADTAPAVFGSLGIPIIVLTAITGLPAASLSTATAWVLCPVSAILPAYLILVLCGWKGLKGVLPAVVISGGVFGGTEFVILNYAGVQLTNILSALLSIVALLVLFRFWKPKDEFVLPSHHVMEMQELPRHHPIKELVLAWSPYILLVFVVTTWALKPVQARFDDFSLVVNWPWLHNEILRVAPLVSKPSPYGAAYNLSWLSASGTACFVAALLSALILGITPRQFVKVFFHTCRKLMLAEITMAAVVGLAYLMNYSGATGTLGLAFASTGVLFAFFSGWLGWLGVFLTGTDTAANALFGNLQVVTANRLGMSPTLMAAANSCGGVMGKMISLGSIAVAATAADMKGKDEANLFRFTIRHSLVLTLLVCLLVVVYSHFLPHL